MYIYTYLSLTQLSEACNMCLTTLYNKQKFTSIVNELYHNNKFYVQTLGLVNSPPIFYISLVLLLKCQHASLYLSVQRNPYIADTIGELHVGRYRGPAVTDGFYKYYMKEVRT